MLAFVCVHLYPVYVCACVCVCTRAMSICVHLYPVYVCACVYACHVGMCARVQSGPILSAADACPAEGPPPGAVARHAPARRTQWTASRCPLRSDPLTTGPCVAITKIFSRSKNSCCDTLLFLVSMTHAIVGTLISGVLLPPTPPSLAGWYVRDGIMASLICTQQNLLSPLR